MTDIWKEKYEQLQQEEIKRLTTEIARLKLEISQRQFNQEILIKEPVYYPVNVGCPCESYNS